MSKKKTKSEAELKRLFGVCFFDDECKIPQIEDALNAIAWLCGEMPESKNFHDLSHEEYAELSKYAYELSERLASIGESLAVAASPETTALIVEAVKRTAR